MAIPWIFPCSKNLGFWSFGAQLDPGSHSMSSGTSYGHPLDLLSSMPASRVGNGTPLQYSCLENPMDGGAW